MTLATSREQAPSETAAARGEAVPEPVSPRRDDPPADATSVDSSNASPEAAPRPLPGWFLTPGHVALAALWGLLFMIFNNLPLAGGALWGHILYGEWILEHRAVPAEDPFMPLAAGIRVLDQAWLTQVVLAAVEQAGGLEWLSHLFALVVLATYLLLARACFLVSGSLGWSTLATLAALILAGGRATAFRAETFGAFCFALLLWLVASSGALAPGRGGAVARSGRLWAGVPLLFVLWANLHGSWIFGFAFLASCFAGRVLAVGWRERSLRRVAEDRRSRRWLWLAELALVAALINPYGLDLVLDAFGFDVTGNLREQSSALQLAINGGPGLALLVSWLVIGLLLARGRWPAPAALAPWLFFAGAAATGVQKLTWYAPVFAVVLASAVPAFRGRSASVPRLGDAPAQAGCFGPSPLSTMVAVVVAFAAFVFSPLGAGLVAGVSRTTGQLLGPGTPIALTGYLQANPPRGRIFNTQAWGDWLVYEGPPGLEPFVTSKVELVPVRVWLDYQRATQAGYEWERIFNRYRIDTVILDDGAQRLLSRAVRFTDGWSLLYDDGRAVVYGRDRSFAAAGDAAPEDDAEDTE